MEIILSTRLLFVWAHFVTALLRPSVLANKPLLKGVAGALQRDLPKLKRHCVSSFGKGLNVTDVRFYVTLKHCRFYIYTHTVTIRQKN